MTILMPVELASKIVADAKLPTEDGKNVLPLNIESVKILIARAITEDRGTVPDFDVIADKVLSGWTDGQGAATLSVARNAILVALSYAQAGGARFQKSGPSESDYADAVQNAVEAFCTSLKDKGLWK